MASGQGGAYDYGSLIVGGGGKSIFPTLPTGKKVVFETIQEVDHGTAGASIQIFEATSTKGQGKMDSPRNLQLVNPGRTAVSVTIKIPTWSDDTTQSGSAYLQMILSSGQVLHLPTTQIIDTLNVNTNDGTVVSTFTAPNALGFIDSGANLAAHVDSPDISISVDKGLFFRIGDLIQIGVDTSTTTRREILEVTSITDTAGDGAYTPAALGVRRALYGTAAADKDAQTDATEGAVSGANVYLPIFNDIDDIATLGVKTDPMGRYHVRNFFGLGRGETITASGILPGSVAFQFYSAPFHAIGLQGISATTDSGLTAGRTMSWKVKLNGGTADDLTFTVDSTKIGGPNGILRKMQDSMNTAYKDSTANMFQKRVTVALSQGDIVFTFHERTSSSTIELEAGATGADNTYKIFAAANGIFPAVANIRGKVATFLPKETIYDNSSYAEVPNVREMAHDNGRGVIGGTARGTIDYDSGELSIQGPPNADFVYIVSHTTGLGGRSSSDKKNLIETISARSCNPKINATIGVRVIG